MKEFIKEYSVNKEREHTAVRISLESKLKSLPQSLNNNISNELFREYEECKNRLESFYQNVTNGLIIRSEVDWYENRKNDLILIMPPEKQDKTLELSKHLSADSTPAR